MDILHLAAPCRNVPVTFALDLMGPFKSGWDERDVEAVIARDDPMELLYVPIVVGMNADAFERSWAEGVCLKLAEHPHFNVRGNALMGLGHIARVCRAIDTDRAALAISQGLRDPHKDVRSNAEGAAADLEMYLNFTVPGYDGAHTREVLGAIEALRKKHEI